VHVSSPVREYAFIVRSHRPLLIAFVVSLLITLAIACGTSTTEPPNDGAACVPGQQINCGCPGGVDGTQVCKDDRRGYGICVCPDAGLDATDDSPVDAPGDAPPQGCSESDAGPGGELNWAKNFGISGSSDPNAVAIDPSTGDIVVAGAFIGSTNLGGGVVASHGDAGAGADIFVARYDKSGAFKWAKTFGNGQLCAAHAVAVDASGNVVVAGGLQGSLDFGGGALAAVGDQDVFVAKFDAGGAHVWSKSFGVVAQTQNLDSVAIDSAGNVFAAGVARGGMNLGGGPLTGYFIGKFSSAGAHEWSKGFAASCTGAIPTMALDPSGNPILAGCFSTTVDFGGGALTPIGGESAFAAKFTSGGSYAWAKRYGDSGGAAVKDVGTDGCGDVVLAGEFFGTMDFGSGKTVTGPDPTKSYLFVAKLDASGSAIWAKNFVGSKNAVFTGESVTADATGAVILACRSPMAQWISVAASCPAFQATSQSPSRASRQTGAIDGHTLEGRHRQAFLRWVIRRSRRMDQQWHSRGNSESACHPTHVLFRHPERRSFSRAKRLLR
jgi:hypothetical protein